MRSKFEPYFNAESNPSPMPWVDSEAYDASEDQFAARLEAAPSPQPKFVVENSVVEEKVHGSKNSGEIHSRSVSPDAATPLWSGDRSSEPRETTPAQPQLLQQPDPDAWRQEVAARLNNYRAKRRPRAPRYPSLRLKFEPYEPMEPKQTNPAWSATASEDEINRPTRQAITVESACPVPDSVSIRAVPDTLRPQPSLTETTARIIEFPRSSNTPPRRLEELADPVIDRPRILEAPELAPPPPALGGILMDPAEVPADEKRPGFEIPLQPAPLSRRLAAAAVDAIIVLLAVAGSAYAVFKITATAPALQPAVGMAVLVIGLFWAGYQYLLLVHTGSTPGLRIAKLQLSLFDGSPAPRKVRRWRVVASILSGVSLGLGYAWCFLDEDQLCWHDRITRTYMAPSKVSGTNA